MGKQPLNTSDRLWLTDNNRSCSSTTCIQIGKAEQLGNLEQTFLALRRNSSSDLVPIIHK